MEPWIQVFYIALGLMVARIPAVKANLPVFYMDERCNDVLDMEIEGIEGARLMLRRPDDGMRYLQCPVTIKAPAGKRISFRFLKFDIPSAFGSCMMDHLQIFNDQNVFNPSSQVSGMMCSAGEIPESVYTTNENVGLLNFRKRQYNNDQFDLIFTSFYEGDCGSGEYRCRNQHCIAKKLYCNGFDNCGDDSDHCVLTEGAIAAVVVAAVVVVVVLAFILAYCCYRKQQRQRMEKVSGRKQGILRTFINI